MEIDLAGWVETQKPLKMATVYRNYPCFSVCERCCSCGNRCVALIGMTIKNPLWRFGRSRMFNLPGGCDHFEWVDDSLCDKVRSIMVSLIVWSKTLLQENQHLQTTKEEAAYDRDVVKRVREKNSRLKMENSRLKMQNSCLKMQLVDYQMRERKVLWGLLLLFAVVIGVGFTIGGGK